MKFVFPSSNKAIDPTVERGLKVEYAQAKRGGFRGRWYLLLVLVIAPVLVMFGVNSI